LLSDHFPEIMPPQRERVECVSHAFAEALEKKEADSLHEVEQERHTVIAALILLWFYLREAILSGSPGFRGLHIDFATS
jgi:hypothetical protein